MTFNLLWNTKGDDLAEWQNRFNHRSFFTYNESERWLKHFFREERKSYVVLARYVRINSFKTSGIFTYIHFRSCISKQYQESYQITLRFYVMMDRQVSQSQTRRKRDDVNMTAEDDASRLRKRQVCVQDEEDPGWQAVITGLLCANTNTVKHTE